MVTLSNVGRIIRNKPVRSFARPLDYMYSTSHESTCNKKPARNSKYSTDAAFGRCQQEIQNIVYDFFLA